MGRTQEKIVNPGWHESASYDTFKGEVDKSQLSSKCGGDHSIEYTYEWEVAQSEQKSQLEVYGKHVYPTPIADEQGQTKENQEDTKEKEAEIEMDDDSKLCVVCL